MLETLKENISTAQLNRLSKFGKQMANCGVNFFVCEPHGSVILQFDGNEFFSNTEQLADYAGQAFQQKLEGTNTFGEKGQVLIATTESRNKAADITLIIDCGLNAGYNGKRLQLFCSNNSIDYELLANIIHSDRTDVKYLQQSLDIFAEDFQLISTAQKQIDMVSSELLQAYEELMLLHTMGSNMKVTHSDANYLQIACDSLRDIINVEGIAILCEKK